MKREFYEKERDYRIYAIILKAETDCVYIGKSAGKRISAVYYRHRRGSVQATVGYFDQEERPELYLLEELTVTGSDAYRHVVAWCAVFRKNGYAGINHEGTLFQSENLLPETRIIAEEFMQEPLDQILARSWLASPASADKPSEKHGKTLTSEKTTQINMRLHKRDKECFDKYCKSRNLNQREAFEILLDGLMGFGEHPGIDHVLQDRNKRIASLEQENVRLQKKLETWISRGKSPKELEQENMLRLLKNGLQCYFQILLPEAPGKSTLPELSYRKYIQSLSPGQEKPKYPETEGFLLLRLEAFLWGSSGHRASFLVGIGEDGCRYRLRFFPKENYLGVSPRFSAWAFAESWWYVCSKRSKDDAMDMIAAFPMGERREHAELDRNNRQIRKESLENAIQRAERKKRDPMILKE